jgi:uncharacterized protein YjbJ (UPF0337 family)
LGAAHRCTLRPEPWRQDHVRVLSFPIRRTKWTRTGSRAPRSRPRGKVKEWAGKITGDSKTEAEGKADPVKGKVQNTIGGIKDTMRGE